jgi:threonine dehydrogenase-like Zn-dependent dehydrogenase
MKAVVWKSSRRVAVEEVPDPQIEEPGDAVIRVTATAICGSDLHLYDHGLSLMMKPGNILGHEAMGVVEEVGPRAGAHLSVGDTVVVPFNISCGHCFMCERGLYAQCETTQNEEFGKGSSLFGHTRVHGGIPGGQAEYLRVPHANFGPVVLDPEKDADVPQGAALLLSDVLPTAWQAVQFADIPRGGSVAIHGLGPVGQMCVRVARHRGAHQVIGIDPSAHCRAQAAEYGAEVIDPADVDDVVGVVRESTAGRGADSSIDAVGMDALGSMTDQVLQKLKLQPDRLIGLHQALGTVRRGGTCSVVGLYGGWFPAFPLGDLFDRGITLRWGQTHVRRWTDQLLAVLRDGDQLDADGLISMWSTLDAAPELYEKFRAKEPGYTKIAMRPVSTDSRSSGESGARMTNESARESNESEVTP